MFKQLHNEVQLYLGTKNKDYFITETIAKTAIHESVNKNFNVVWVRIRNKVKQVATMLSSDNITADYGVLWA